ncbi:Mini-ribonuclease 3 [Desulfosporosinus sp. BICA1-9]|uniref:Mini-ribonuclease 3 n=1 Tax=Desulfosporosinus sp. BICA1-9 TaxID=1531958 RepID=UPI00054BBF09|nr:ribonuclease III domain-containing protein [Desulfosporosinus sp. BICA1-9]KJS49367.1 MAG: Mini-ribonuclease 3 [Peptococcaceae bacterium BRH_c23]KJS90285.1 MAG: Mini-ribonuclease 3 [Desulfosporosinus sp. BICA1-9]HBW35388.1 Mini-ribonuclease 3 [Desulfosporosinus sp.]
MRNWQEMNALTLAYLGDAVYELWVRTHLLELGHEKVRELHKQAVSYVRASTQARVLHVLWPELDEVEQQVVLRGRNAKGGHPKNVDVVTYRHATAFESLVGYWQLNGQSERMGWAFSHVDRILLHEGAEKDVASECK